MSYQEQLAYLRNKYNLEAEKVNEDTTPAWEEVDEETDKRLKEREERDRWIDDAGLNPTYQINDPLTTKGGRERMVDFDSKFNSNPIVQKYGPQLFEAVQQMLTEVNNPNTPFDMNQAQEMVKQLVVGIRQEVMNDSKQQ